MRTMTCGFVGLLLLLAASLGCTTKPAESSDPVAEAEVREKFTAVQKAIVAKDADKLWDLLAARSRTAAENEAKSLRAAYEEASPERKAALEKETGTSGPDLAKLTGKGFLGTKTFRDKRDEIGDGVVTKVTAGADSATVYFDEPDGDHEKLVFVREEGQWKAWMAMPKAKTSP